jgi:hypothetical protein
MSPYVVSATGDVGAYTIENSRIPFALTGSGNTITVGGPATITGHGNNVRASAFLSLVGQSNTISAFSGATITQAPGTNVYSIRIGATLVVTDSGITDTVWTQSGTLDLRVRKPKRTQLDPS